MAERSSLGMVAAVVSWSDGLMYRREPFAGAPAGPAHFEPKPVLAEEADLPEQVRQAVERLNQTMETLKVESRFRVLDDPHQVIVEMYDSDTGQMIREIPPRRMLEIYADMMRLVGLNLDREG